MEKKDRQLLIKDLSARLSYGVRIREYNDEYGWSDGVLSTITNDYFSEGEPSIEGDWINRVEDVKPYLRPLYSMTEDEARFILKFILGDQNVYMVNVTKDGIEAYVDDGVASFEKNYVFHNEIVRSLGIFDYLNERQFDYRGLIEKGLALEAPDNMYNLEHKMAL